MRNKIILLLIIVNVLPISVTSLTYGGCDYSTISRLKSLITNINVSYDYRIENDVAYFDITLNNLTSDMYFYDVENRKNYYYKDTNNGEITIKNYVSNGGTGSYKFYSAKNECYGVSLGSKYYKLPSYNIYYKSVLCEGASNYSLCQKWVANNYSQEELEFFVSEYKRQKNNKELVEENVVYKKTIIGKIVEFYIKYYYYLLAAIIVVFGTIIVVKKSKEKIKL